MTRPLLVPFALASFALCAQNPVRITLEVWTPFIGPVVDIAHCGDDRLFAVRQNGMIDLITDSNEVQPRHFLNIETQVDYVGEKGLLGMAFAPDYASSGIFYVHYVAPGGQGISTISRWHVSSDPDSADMASEQVIFSYQQLLYDNHKGGDLDFGPDGMLYIPFGDGGFGGDPDNHAQDLTDPLGDLLRIDVSDPDTTYTIPPDNPYVNANNDTLPEIWASGLRNPFRFGFDRLTGDMWIGDVGQSLWEEWNFWPAGVGGGANFGWRCYEGLEVYDTTNCQPQSFYDSPVLVKAHSGNGGVHCAAIGGRVYRGSLWPHMMGRYFYTDFCAPEFGNLRPDGLGGFIDELSYTSVATGWSCIGENHLGELFTANLGVGKVYKIVDRCPMDPPVITEIGSDLQSTAANFYQWFLDGDTIPGATGQVWQPTVSGVYQVVADFGDECVLSSDTLSFIHTTIAGSTPDRIALAPNPADGSVTVAWNDGEVVACRVVDAAGREVMRTHTQGRSLTLLTHAWPAGGYGVQLLAPEGTVLHSQRLTIVR